MHEICQLDSQINILLQNESYICFLQLKSCELIIYTELLVKLKSVRFLWIFSQQKLHTCKEGRAHPRISVWHLLMNLKNNFLLKKNCWSGPVKNTSILIFTKNLKSNKKIKKNTWRYHYFRPVYQQSSWYDLQFLRYRVWQTEIGSYASFFALLPSPKTPKIRILKKRKNCSRYHHFTQVYQKPQSYGVQFLRYKVRQTEFFVILGHFLPFYSPNNQ